LINRNAGSLASRAVNSKLTTKVAEPIKMRAFEKVALAIAVGGLAGLLFTTDCHADFFGRAFKDAGKSIDQSAKDVGKAIEKGLHDTRTTLDKGTQDVEQSPSDPCRNNPNLPQCDALNPPRAGQR
jgi:hypothetical protein